MDETNATTEERDAKAEIEELVQKIRAIADERMIIGHFGGVEIAGEHRSWLSVRYNRAIPKLLTNPDYKVAQILAALGSEVRLSILRTLLEGPKSVAEIVAQLGFKTTGQAYHHLRELEHAGYVLQKSGKYHFDLEVGRVYLAALALAADAGAEKPELDNGE